jgi:phenylacetate-CoA ligase
MTLFLRRQGFKFFDWATGHNIVQRFNELVHTQWLSSDELQALQLHRLQSLLEYAYQHVPYYRRVFNEVGFQPASLARDPDSFRKIPPVSKVYMRDHTEEFLTTDPAKRESLSRETTSGSTGHPFIFWEDRNFQDYAVANTLRHHSWCGWKPGQPRAYLWPLHIPGGKQTLRDKARNFTWNLFWTDTSNLSEEIMDNLAKFIRRRKPQLLQGWPTPLYFFAQFVRENGYDDVKLPAVYVTSEVLHPHQRRYIEETFECKVLNRYATQETGGIACECEEHTGMHISTETNYVEILNEDDIPVKDGEAGNVVVTCLTNYGFPFIRYRLEDIARMSTRQCPCSRGQPMLEVVEGRLADMFETRDGRTVMGNFYIGVMFEVEGIKRFKMIQKSLDLILVQLVVSDALKKPQLDFIERTIKATMGPGTEVKFEFLDSIPAGRGGKFCYAVSEVSSAK